MSRHPRADHGRLDRFIRALRALALGAVVVTFGVACGGGSNDPTDTTIELRDDQKLDAVDLVSQVARARFLRPTGRLQIAETAARPLLLDGWSTRTRAIAQREGLWSSGDRSVIELVSARAVDSTLRFACLPSRELAEDAEIELSINGRSLGRIALEPRYNTYEIAVPADLMAPGPHQLVITNPPLSERPERKDQRLLWDWIELDQGLAPVPNLVVRPDRGSLFLPTFSRLDFFLELQPNTRLVADKIRSRGSQFGRLEVAWRPLDGDEVILAEDLSTRPDFAVRLNGDAPTSGRLSLRSNLEQEPDQDGVGMLLMKPTLETAVPKEIEEPQLAVNRAPEGELPNVVIYLIDTLRSDHLGAYSSLDISPHIDRFAETAHLFERSQAQSPWTRASVASMLTGLLPRQHTVEDQQDALSDDAFTLAEAMQQLGYQTAAVTSNGNAAQLAGFGQGFDFFKHLAYLREGEKLATADDVNAEVFQWLDDRRKDGPFLLWVHTIDPHAPYEPPQEFIDKFAPGVPLKFGTMEMIKKVSSQQEPVAAEIVDKMLQLYQAEVAANDASFGRLLDKLRSLDEYENSLIIVLSDHGEEFYEHGNFTHGKTLYAEVLDTPLILRLPGQTAGTRLDAVARHVDLLPTLLDYLGADPLPNLAGESLLPIIEQPALEWSNSSIAHLRLRGRTGTSYLAGDWKIIQKEADSVEHSLELYNRSRDPLELEDLALEKPDLARLLDARRRAEEAAAGARLEGRAANQEELDRARAELKALGYID